MKKSFVLGAAVAALLSMAGCASTPVMGGGDSGRMSRGLSGVPDFVNEAYLNASEDVIIGIGTYRIGNDMSKMGTGKTFAETRAQADIARQLSSIVRNMVNDYTAMSEIDPDAAVSFQENITQTLSRAELNGSKTVKLDRDNNGLLWVVMEFSKSAAAAFDAVQRMETAFTKEAGGRASSGRRIIVEIDNERTHERAHGYRRSYFEIFACGGGTYPPHPQFFAASCGVLNQRGYAQIILCKEKHCICFEGYGCLLFVRKTCHNF
jgi:hypothetical protein